MRAFLLGLLAVLFMLFIPSLAQAGGFVGVDLYGRPVVLGYQNGPYTIASDSYGHTTIYRSYGSRPVYAAPGPRGYLHHRERTRTFRDGSIRSSIYHRSW